MSPPRKKKKGKQAKAQVTEEAVEVEHDESARGTRDSRGDKKILDTSAYGTQTILEWCQHNFAEFRPAPRVCKTWVDTSFPAVFLGTSVRHTWDNDWAVYAVLSNFHCDRPVMVDIDRCDFEVTKITQLSDNKYQVLWETDELTVEPASNIREILNNPKCEISLLDGTHISPPDLSPELNDGVTCTGDDGPSELTEEQTQNLNTSLAVASSLSLWEQLLRLYPSEVSQNIAHEHRRLIGENGPAAMLKSPPAKKLKNSLELSVANLFRNSRGFSSFVDSLVIGACMNVHPSAMYEFATSSSMNSPLPPHPLTVLSPFLEKHKSLLWSLPAKLPQQWVHLLKCHPKLFVCFPLPQKTRSALLRFQRELKKHIDFIQVEGSDHLPSLLDRESSTSSNSPMSSVIRQQQDTNKTSSGRVRRQPKKLTDQEEDVVVQNKNVRKRRGLEAEPIGNNVVGFLIDDILGGFGVGPVPVINTVDNTTFRNVQIVDRVVTALQFKDSPKMVRCKCRSLCRKGPCRCGSATLSTLRPDLFATHTHNTRTTNSPTKPPTPNSASYVNGKVATTTTGWIVECHPRCSCGPNCTNRVVQQHLGTRVEVIYCGAKGWGVKTLQDIAKGSFVYEYIGELIATEEAESRGRTYDKSRVTTLYDLDAALKENRYTLDASYHCSVARFFNHSCSPNLVNYQVLFDHHDVERPHICFFAAHDIKIGEELTFDYRYQNVKKVLRCHCGEKNCRKWLM